MSAGHVTRVRKLYKLILRLHRNLPEDLRVLGDLYAKEEFKRHKKCMPVEARTFLYEWQDYAAHMLRQAAPIRGQRPTPTPERDPAQAGVPANKAEKPLFGNDLTLEYVNSMTHDQLYTLYLLLANAHGNSDTIDAGIELLDADVYANKINQAKKYINEIKKKEMEKVARGELKVEDMNESQAWLKLFDLAVSTARIEPDAESGAKEEKVEEEGKVAKKDK